MSDDSSSKQSRKVWSVPAGVAITLLAVVFTQPLAALVVAMFPTLAGWEAARAEEWLYHSPVANFITILLFDALALLIVALFIVRRYKESFWRAVALKRARWRDPAFAIIGFLAYLGLATIALIVVPLIFPIDTDQEQATGFEPGSGTTALVLAFAGLVILAPIVEEIVFRGFLYGTLRNNKISAVWAAVVTSLLFAALHLFGSASGGLLWVGFVDTFILSLVLCYVREQTGSLWASIGIHFFKNAFVFVNIFILSAT
jgi:membrane protease YdiL (CAAX protease family)